MGFTKAVGVLLISGGFSFESYFILHFDIQLLSNPDGTLTDGGPAGWLSR